MDTRTKITLAIRQGCRDWPWLATLLLRARPVEKTGIGTVGCDQRLKFYFDPEFVDATEMRDLTYLVKRSVVHPILRHPKRGQWIITDQKTQQAFALASELSAHQMFSADGQYIPDNANTIHSFRMKDGSQLPQGLCLEEYFSEILKDITEDENQPEDHGPQDSGSNQQSSTSEDDIPQDYDDNQQSSTSEDHGPQDSDGNQQSTPPDEREPDPINYGNPTGPQGSSQDGQPREWEDVPEPDQPEEGVSKDELDRLVKHLSETASPEMSRVGGADFALSADGVARPKIRPEQLLRQAIAKKVSKFRRGSDQQTFRRPSRRSQPSDEFIRPSYIKPTPNVTVVVDSSGSMGRDDIKLGLGMVDLAIKGMQLGEVRVVSGDTDIKNDQKRITCAAEVIAKGGGGTCMDRIVNNVLSDKGNQLPDLLILVTDGGTDWPDKHKIPFVACVTRTKEDTYFWDTPPEWMPLVHVA